MREETAPSLSDLVMPVKLALRRYAWIIVPPSIVICGLLLLATAKLPNYYTADALIFSEPQKVATKLVETENKLEQEERLQSLAFEILSHQRLRSIIEQFNLYPDYQGVHGKEKALKIFRDAITVEPLISHTGKQLTQTFKLSYQQNDPKLAFEVTKALSNLFIEESLIAMKGQTQGTEEFLDAQLRSSRQKLEMMESQVQEFVRANFERLPDNLDAAKARLENAQARMSANSQLITANTTRSANLRQELGLLSKEGPGGEVSGQAISNNPEEGLQQLQSALMVLKSRYSDEHPDVISTKRRIEALKAQLGGSKNRPVRVTSGRNTDEARRLRIELGEIEAQTKALVQENESLKLATTELGENIKQMPLKDQELTKIRRDYENVKKSYERLLGAREDAGFQSSLVNSQKGAQFRIVEPPSLPVIATGPNRPLLTTGALFVGLLLFLSLPVGLAYLNGAFKSRDELEKELGFSVLAVIPPMATPKASAVARRALSASVVFSLIVFAAGGAAIFTLVR